MADGALSRLIVERSKLDVLCSQIGIFYEDNTRSPKAEQVAPNTFVFRFCMPMKFQNHAEARRISRVAECSVDDCKRRRAGIQDFQTGDFVHKRALERRNFKHD